MPALKSNQLTATFTVTAADLDPRGALSICRILSSVTEQTDAAVISATGTLDYSKLQVKHYSLDIVGSAALRDVVQIRTSVTAHNDEELAIGLQAVRRRGNRELPLVNGRFVFTGRKQAAAALLPA